MINKLLCRQRKRQKKPKRRNGSSSRAALRAPITLRIRRPSPQNASGGRPANPLAPSTSRAREPDTTPRKQHHRRRGTGQTAVSLGRRKGGAGRFEEARITGRGSTRGLARLGGSGLRHRRDKGGAGKGQRGIEALLGGKNSGMEDTGAIGATAEHLPGGGTEIHLVL